MKAALVTGGAKRIGAEIVRILAADGWRVLIHYNTSSSEAVELKNSLTQAGAKVDIINCDLSDLDSTRDLIPRCVELVGPIECLINNASVFEIDWITTVDANLWQRQMDVNLRAPTLLTRAFSEALPNDRSGCIINMLDNKVFSPNPDYFSYSICKFGLKGLTEMSAMSLGPRIRVCGIAPGLTTISGEQTEEEFEKQSRQNLLKRSSDPGEVAKAVQFILASSIFNGQVIVVDGGQTLMRLKRDVAFLNK